VRRAIRETRKVRITYANAEGQQSDRTVWPVAMAYYVDVTLLGAWCELRSDFRHFRVDRIVTSRILDDRFSTDNGRLMERWFALQSEWNSASRLASSRP
jgi:predicted DNA-binding transcriptional regulator YafY